MDAGRELDALIAEKVMGWRRVLQPADYDGNHQGEPVLFPPSIDDKTYVYPPKGKVAFSYFVPHYSTSIADAWVVVEMMPWPVGIHRYPDRTYETTVYLSEFHVVETAATAPLSICLAALKAVEVAHV